VGTTFRLEFPGISRVAGADEEAVKDAGSAVPV